MKVIVSGRNIEVTSAIKSYAEEKISKFERYLSNITEAAVTLTVEKYRHKTEVLLKVNGILIQAEGTTGDLYSSIDEVVDKLEAQVKKYKEKLVEHRKGEGRTAGLSDTTTEPELETGRIIKKKSFDMKPMSPDEAVMQLELTGHNFFVFANQSSGDINVIYRREDGNFGLIEPTK